MISNHLNSVLRDLPRMLSDAGSDGRSTPPPSRADELALVLDRTPPVQRRLDQARLAGVGAVRTEAGSLLSAASGTSSARPTFGDLLDVIVAFRRFSAWHDVVTFIDSVSDRYAVGAVPFPACIPLRSNTPWRSIASGTARRPSKRQERLWQVVHDPIRETMEILGRVYKDRWLRLRTGTGAEETCCIDQGLCRGSYSEHARGLSSN